MADPIIKIKRSSVANKVPTPADLQLGELAINTNDAKVYLEQQSGITTVVCVNPWSVGLGSTGYNINFKRGHVGVGTDLHVSILTVGDVSDFVSWRGALSVKTTPSTGTVGESAIYLEEQSGTEGWYFKVNVNGDLIFNNSGSATESFEFMDNDHFHVRKGHVGILTDTAADALVVNGNAKVIGVSTFQGNVSLDAGLYDINDSLGTDTYVLTSTGAGVSWSAASGGASAINDLTDVTITSATQDQILRYTGSQWINTNSINLSGVSTFAGLTTVTGSDLFAKQVNVSGATTFYGDVSFVGATYTLLWDASENSLEFPDNAQFRFGDSADMVFYHNGSNSIIVDQGGGDLYLAGDANIVFTNSATTETKAKMTSDGPVELYFDNVKKIETSVAGVLVSGQTTTTTLNVTGVSTFGGNMYIDAGLYDINNSLGTDTYVLTSTGAGVSWSAASGGASAINDLTDVTITSATADDILRYNGSAWINDKQINLSGVGTFSEVKSSQLNVTGVSTFQNNVHLLDNDVLNFGTGNDLQIYHSGSFSFIKDTGTGALIINSDTVAIKNAADNANLARFLESAECELYYNGNEKFATTNTGVNVVGTAVCDGLTVDGTVTVNGTSTLNGQVTPQTLNVTGVSTFGGNMNIDAGLYDINNSLGTDTYVLTSTGAGVSWAAQSGGAGVSTHKHITTYGSGTQANTTEVTVDLDTTGQTSGAGDFTVSAGGVITVVNAGRYLVHYSVTTNITSGTARSGTYVYLRLNGSGEVTASRSYMYNRQATIGGDTASKQLVMNLAANDTLELRSVRYAGTDSTVVELGYSTFTIESIEYVGGSGGGGGGVSDGDKGDITVTSSGATWTIDNDVVTNAKLANVATATIKGRVTAATGDPEDLTGTQATTLLDTFTTSLKGLAPASGGGTSNFLRADGSWAAPPGGSGGTIVVWDNQTVVGTAVTTVDFGTNLTTTYDGVGIVTVTGSAASGGGDGGTFNTGITTAIYDAVDGGIGANQTERNDIFIGPGAAYTFPATAGKRYIIESIQLANVHTADVYLVARHDYSGLEDVPMAQRVIIPYQGALELLENPIVANPSDEIRLQSLDGVASTANAVNAGLDAFLVYTEKTDTTYVGIGSTCKTTDQPIYTASAQTVIESITASNYSLSANVDVSVSIFRGAVRLGYLCKDLTVPKNSVVEVIAKPKYLANGDSIRATGSADGMAVRVSGKTY